MGEGGLKCLSGPEVCLGLLLVFRYSNHKILVRFFGINALVARYYGARDRQELQRTVHSSAIICLICGILLLIFGFFGSRPLLRLLNTKPELLDKATLYMQIYFCGMPALALYNFGNAVYSAIGNTKSRCTTFCFPASSMWC